MSDEDRKFRVVAILFFIAILLLTIFGGGCAPSRELRAVARTQEVALTDYVAVANLAIEKDPILVGMVRDNSYWIAVGEKLVRNQGDICDLLGVKRAKQRRRRRQRGGQPGPDATGRSGERVNAAD